MSGPLQLIVNLQTQIFLAVNYSDLLGTYVKVRFGRTSKADTMKLAPAAHYHPLSFHDIKR